jgi:hypothetical protein
MPHSSTSGFVASVLLSLSIALAGCSSANEPTPASPAAAAAPARPAPVPDHSSLFPDKGKVSAAVVPDHLLDMKALPGGTVADYDVKGQKYQMFIIDTDTNQKAAFMMLDMKAEMKEDPDYLAHMGGYFGMYGDKPLYCFAKLHYVAGIVGLPRDKADPLAIELAAQLN